MKERNITILAVLYTVLVYAAPALFYAVVTFLPDFLKGLAYVILFLPVALAVINVIYIKKNFNALSRDVLLRGALIVKYVLIPFYIVGNQCSAICTDDVYAGCIYGISVTRNNWSFMFFWLDLSGGRYGLFACIYHKGEKRKGTRNRFVGNRRNYAVLLCNGCDFFNDFIHKG